MTAGLSGVNAAFRSMRSERSIFELVVRFAGLVQRFAADAVETEFGGPWQHQRAAAAVAINPLQRPSGSDFSIAWPPQVRIASVAISLAPSIAEYCAA